MRPFSRGLAGDIARRAREGGELFVGSRPFHDDDLRACLGPVGLEAWKDASPEDPVIRLRESFERRTRNGSDYLTWMSYLALRAHLVEDFLTRLDRMGMAHSVEGRVPLLDPVLVGWAFGIPQSTKVPGFRQKALMRAAVSPLLPDYVLERPKQGFCPPVVDWATSLMAKRPVGRPLVDRGLIAPGALDRLRSAGTPNASFAAWTLATLGAWCDANL